MCAPTAGPTEGLGSARELVMGCILAWAGIWGQKAAQDPGPPACHPTVRWQAGGPGRMPGIWPRILGPPDQPGEGGGGRGETPWLLCASFARGGQATVHLGNGRLCHSFHGCSRRGPPPQIQKESSPTYPQKCPHQTPRPTRRPMPRSSEHGPSGRHGSAIEGSSAGQLAHDKSVCSLCRPMQEARPS